MMLLRVKWLDSVVLERMIKITYVVCNDTCSLVSAYNILGSVRIKISHIQCTEYVVNMLYVVTGGGCLMI